MFYLISTDKRTGRIDVSTGNGVGIYRRKLACRTRAAADKRAAEAASWGVHAVVCEFKNDAAARAYCSAFNGDNL
jgi:hypothetical protein